MRNDSVNPVLSTYMREEDPVVLTIGDKQYLIQKYQGDHRDEYSVMEARTGVPDGKAQLFKNGVIKMAWIMKQGIYSNPVTVYINGVVDRVTTWENMEILLHPTEKGRIREKINDISGKRLLVEKVASNGIIIYKGEYNKETSKKEGWGDVFDEQSGMIIQHGYFQNDKLIHLHQSFHKNENGDLIMYEYDGQRDDNNVDNVFKRHVIYIGGFFYDSNENVYRRYGQGYEINGITGICDCVGEWDIHGEKIEERQQVLHRGWYGEIIDEIEGGVNESISPSAILQREEGYFVCCILLFHYCSIFHLNFSKPVRISGLIIGKLSITCMIVERYYYHFY